MHMMLILRSTLTTQAITSASIQINENLFKRGKKIAGRQKCIVYVNFEWKSYLLWLCFAVQTVVCVFCETLNRLLSSTFSTKCLIQRTIRYISVSYSTERKWIHEDFTLPEHPGFSLRSTDSRQGSSMLRPLKIKSLISVTMLKSTRNNDRSRVSRPRQESFDTATKFLHSGAWVNIINM